MSTEPNAEREAMHKRAREVHDKGFPDQVPRTRYEYMADFALAETATLRQQLATAREALEKIDSKGMSSSRARIVNSVREALAKMEEQR